MLDVTPEALVAAEAQVTAITARMVAANAAHAVACAMILPPGSDAPSVRTALCLQGGAGAHQVSAAMGNEELGRSAIGIGESSASYAVGDTQLATAFGAVAV
ncbi:PE family protein [Mycobacterium sp. DBP42]|uniref:PE family protein n=1 Tax=Mycobacteriaceae TaxID=1762 RepID=UPI00110CBDE0|nr:PE family protein [Mycobacterium sp. DBP42]TMS50686.1 PE family protein [Mycobacterium sp. DBP42]